MLQPKLDESPTAEPVAGLYDRDPVLWSEQQAELLTAVSNGRMPPGLDWVNIIEEIVSVGRSQVDAVESLLLQALIHEFKALLWPDTVYVEGWRNESLQFQAQAVRQFTPSMRQKIDPARLTRLALRAMPRTIDGTEPRPASALQDLSADALRAVNSWVTDPEGTLIRLVSA